MHIFEHGPASAPAVLLIHGQVEGASTFDALVPRLATSHHVLVPEMPGYGSSPLPANEFRYETARAELGEELAKRRITRAAVVGFSIGAHHAVGLALDRPSLVDRLFLLGPVVGLDDPVKAQFAGLRDLVKGPQPLSAFDEMLLAQWLPPETARARPDLVSRVLGVWHAAPRPTLIAEFDAVTRLTDLRPRLGDVRAPTVVRVGAEDRAVPPGSVEAIARGIPGAVHQVVARAGHLLLLEDADATAKAIWAHVAGRG
jgi:2-hydroxy-6-oxonona-2,4-dienedioate hydrolase